MDIFYLVIMILGGMTLSLIAIYVWVGMWDGIIAVIKRIFRINKKQKVNWHTLEGNDQSISKEQIEQSKDSISEDERLY
ncbi:MAG: hypothetical protein RR585_01645 [Coprobacillus sp.]